MAVTRSYAPYVVTIFLFASAILIWLRSHAVIVLLSDVFQYALQSGSVFILAVIIMVVLAVPLFTIYYWRWVRPYR